MRHQHHTSPLNIDTFFSDIIGNIEGIFDKDMQPIKQGRAATNIIDKATTYEFEIAAPGRNKNDFSIQLEGNTLTISTIAKKSNEEDSKTTADEWKYIKRGFFKDSAIKKSFQVPKNADKESISARYNNGVLSVIITKIIKKTSKQQIEIS